MRSPSRRPSIDWTPTRDAAGLRLGLPHPYFLDRLQADVRASFTRALERQGLPYAYLLFEGEQHGFRKAEHIIRSLEAELTFYGRILGFEPADHLPDLDVRNLAPSRSS